MREKALKTAVCAIGRMENRYAKEFVEHYLGIGFTHIFVCDNNHDGEERFEDVLQKYIDKGKVTIENFRNREGCQKEVYNEIYKKHNKDYDWMAFFDFDEFLVIPKKIGTFLKDYKSFDCVKVNWMTMTDNGLVRYDDRPLMERFTEQMSNDRGIAGDFPENNHVKSIVRGGIEDMKFLDNPHVPSTPLKCCNVRKEPCGNSPFEPYDHSIAYIKHFFTKTIEEWITNKCVRGNFLTDFKKDAVTLFFKVNERTDEKEEYIEEKMHGKNTSDYLIWVSYHKDEQLEQYGLTNDKHHRLFPTHKDADGENINMMNPAMSEMVTMWYVWKNSLKSEYVGFEHYRRHLDVHRMPKKGECQVFRIGDFGEMTVYDQFSMFHNRHDLDVALDVLDDKYGKNNDYSKHIRESHRLIAHCTFLMRWTDFARLCKFLFPVLEEYSRRMGIEGLDEHALQLWREKADKDFGGRDVEYQMRNVSFIAERLISAWISKHLVPFNGIDVVIVHYNSPELTGAAIRSLNKTTPGCRVHLFDNSDSRPFTEKIPNVEVIDNTNGQVIDFEEFLKDYPDRVMEDMAKSNFGSAKHCKSVDYMMDILPDGFILMDSDVLIKKNIKPFRDMVYSVSGVEFGKHKVVLFQPFLCWINVPMLRKYGIRYFNGEKMWALTYKEPERWYDTGAWLHEEVMRHRLPWKFLNIYEYMIHFGHGSWRGNEDRVNSFLETNAMLWK